MNRLLIICGPTATGKTDLALALAKKFSSDIISADSRQVYTHMDVVTGKDIPPEFEFHKSSVTKPGINIGYYTDGNVKIWGYDLVEPDQEFSVKTYFDFAHTVLADIVAKQALPILVGGTGLYIDAVVKSLDRIHVPRNKMMREKYSKKSAEELYRILMKTNPKHATLLNRSDRSNPRRLIRILEIVEHEMSKRLKQKDERMSYASSIERVSFDDVLWIGVKAENEEALNIRIDRRVESRIGSEMDKEFEYLEKKGLMCFAPSSTIGYREWNEYIKGSVTKKEAVANWKTAERQFAKRQMTWFRKDKKINWFNIEDDEYKKKIVNMVNRWYS